MKQEDVHTNNETFLAQWIEGDISDQDFKNLVSKEHYASYLKIRKGVDVLEFLQAPLDDSFKAINHKLVPKKPTAKRRLISSNMMKIAAVIIVLLSVAGGFYFNTNNTSVGFSQQMTIALLDDSEVIINSNSDVSYTYTDWLMNRELNLKGEAFFKVKKGKKFTVTTENGTITVLGTQFNIITNDNYFEVACYEGSVKVICDKKEYVLTPNSVFRKASGKDEKIQNNLAPEPTWIYGESSFKSVPLYQVITSLKDKYKVAFDSSQIDTSLMYTGSFTHKDVSKALAAVFKPLEIEYKKEDNGMYVLSY